MRTLAYAIAIAFIITAIWLAREPETESVGPHYQYYELALPAWKGYDGTEMIVEITKYTPREAETDQDPHIMASGKKVYEGAIACPEGLDFGTKLEYDGKIYICEDRMAKRHRDKNKFDIFTFDLAEALDFGTKVAVVKLIEN